MATSFGRIRTVLREAATPIDQRPGARPTADAIAEIVRAPSAGEQQLVHVPEPARQRRGLSHGRGKGMRMDGGQRKMPERDRMFPPGCCSTCSIAWNACRE